MYRWTRVSKSQEKYNELKSIIRNLISSIVVSRFESADIRSLSLSAFFHNIHLIYHDLKIDNIIIEFFLRIRKDEDEYWLLVFRIAPCILLAFIDLRVIWCKRKLWFLREIVATKVVHRVSTYNNISNHIIRFFCILKIISGEETNLFWLKLLLFFGQNNLRDIKVLYFERWKNPLIIKNRQS